MGAHTPIECPTTTEANGGVWSGAAALSTVRASAAWKCIARCRASAGSCEGDEVNGKYEAGEMIITVSVRAGI